METQLTATTANYLNQLVDATRNFKRTMIEVRDGMNADLENMERGFRTSGIGHQRLVELATNEAKHKLLLDMAGSIGFGLDREDWMQLVEKACSGQDHFFLPGDN